MTSPLHEALELWRETRDPTVGKLVHDLTPAMIRPIRAVSDWFTIERAGEPAQVPRLLAFTLRVDDERDEPRNAVRRLRTLVARGPDPRVAAAALRWVVRSEMDIFGYEGPFCDAIRGILTHWLPPNGHLHDLVGRVRPPGNILPEPTRHHLAFVRRSYADEPRSGPGCAEADMEVLLDLHGDRWLGRTFLTSTHTWISERGFPVAAQVDATYETLLATLSDPGARTLRSLEFESIFVSPSAELGSRIFDNPALQHLRYIGPLYSELDVDCIARGPSRPSQLCGSVRPSVFARMGLRRSDLFGRLDANSLLDLHNGAPCVSAHVPLGAPDHVRRILQSAPPIVRTLLLNRRDDAKIVLERGTPDNWQVVRRARAEPRRPRIHRLQRGATRPSLMVASAGSASHPTRHRAHTRGPRPPTTRRLTPRRHPAPRAPACEGAPWPPPPPPTPPPASTAPAAAPSAPRE